MSVSKLFLRFFSAAAFLLLVTLTASAQYRASIQAHSVGSLGRGGL